MSNPIAQNVLPESLRVQWGRLQNLSDEELDVELVHTAESAAENFVRMALIIRQKEERGHDLAGLNRQIGSIMVGYLRKVAYGQLLPDAFARFGSRPRLMRAVAALPLPDQRSCLEETGVKLGEISENGSISHRVLDPNELTDRQIKQIFADDHVRQPEEQIAWLRGNPRHLKQSSPVVVDKRRKELRFNGEGVITRAQLLMYLASMD